ncbi:Splicing factor 3B subunit 2 [Cichlidogyrus casuarinus]|uniref:Splicing factor 3B subunit 2 n=1 Tax=Cichlidogyrus casuarinus TaxID=1844966 RepID=A0ABD2QIV1_9PLAT
MSSIVLGTIKDLSSKVNINQLERQREQNRKKKLKKKASKARKRQDQLQNLQEVNGHQPNAESEEETTLSLAEFGDFEFTGAFERFKLKELDDEQEGKNKLLSHTEVNLKARTAALLEEEARLEEKRRKNPRSKDDEREDDETKKDGDSGVETDKGEEKSLSKKKLKLLNRPSVSSLKRTVNRPDVVEMWDVCAKDPMLLVYLKSYRNTVPVPRHWCAKRKYLQGKRGYEKPPFRLPDYIARTGIMEMRQTVQDKETEKSLKQKMREKIRPKIGRVDIDYHKLHDAFFKYQTKPLLTGHGDLYYEGREFEIKLKEKKPGNLSDDLRMALGLPTGTNADKYPPPWLIAMQRYGPPPSFPNLKIPGLNAPIPPGCAFGYHPGGWGKPPVDEMGRPIYGDVFGNGGNVAGAPPPPPPGLSSLPGSEIVRAQDEEISKGNIALWGEWEYDAEGEGDSNAGSEEEDEEEEEEEGEGAFTGKRRVDAVEEGGSDMEEDDDVHIEPTPKQPIDHYGAGMATPGGGLATPSGTASYMTQGSGAVSTDPSTIELRKRNIESQMESLEDLGSQGQLYRVLPQRDTSVGAKNLMGSAKLYDVSGIGDTNIRGEEVENPRDKMVRKRQANEGESSVPPSSRPNAPQPKKYKEFKF